MTGEPAVSLTDIVEWDVRNWSAALRYWRDQTALDLAASYALELGSRHGGLSLWLGLHGTRVVCSDVCGPTEQAVEKHRRAGVSSLITYETIDATDIPYTGQFDIVLFKSVLGAVGRLGGCGGQAQAVGQMHKALRRGGELWFAENLVASPLHRALRRCFVRWGRTWRYVSLDEMLGFLAPFAQVGYRTLGFAGAFGRSSRQRDALGHLDRLVFDRVVPPPWRYVVVGVAVK